MRDEKVFRVFFLFSFFLCSNRSPCNHVGFKCFSPNQWFHFFVENDQRACSVKGDRLDSIYIDAAASSANGSTNSVPNFVLHDESTTSEYKIKRFRRVVTGVVFENIFIVVPKRKRLFSNIANQNALAIIQSNTTAGCSHIAAEIQIGHDAQCGIRHTTRPFQSNLQFHDFFIAFAHIVDFARRSVAQRRACLIF